MITYSLLTVLLVFLLVFSAYQDFKYRELSLIIFPALFLASFLRCFLLFNFQEAITYTGVNVAVIGIQIAALFIYLYLSGKRHNLLLEKFFGLGDVLMLLSITPLFSTLLFIVFCIISSISSLAYFVVATSFKHKKADFIPLAGVISFLLFFLLLISSYYRLSYYFYSDTLLLSRVNL